MSATNRSGVRVPLDVYPTPTWCVHRLLEEIELPGGHWCEPCAGDGAIIRAVNEVRKDVVWSAVEIRRECDANLVELGATVIIDDALHCEWQLRPEPISVVITNPPYALAEEFLDHALQAASKVALLLRLNFLGSERRAPLFRRCPPDVSILPNRPSFIRGEHDNCEYAWFVWHEGRERPYGRLSVLRPTPRDVRIPRIVKEVRHVGQ